MNGSTLEQLVEAVLYEGYLLYPYRPSAKKNRQRFTFGRVYPQAYSISQKGAEPFRIQTQCLLKKLTASPTLTVTVKFLQPMRREVGVLSASIQSWESIAEPHFQVVNRLEVNGKVFESWDEAVERTVSVQPMALSTSPSAAAETIDTRLEFAAQRMLEPLTDDKDRIVGVICRTCEAVEGMVQVTEQPVEDSFTRVTVQVRNHTPVPVAALSNQDAVLRRTFASTHTVLQVQGGEFVSLMDPPGEHRAAAATCENIGTWPVLVGDEAKGERQTMLSSPIILYDYPKIAAESVGTLFEGTEIEEILSLRVLTLTEEEKREACQADRFARQLLERTERLREHEWMKLHGRSSSGGDPAEAFFGSQARLQGVQVQGVFLQAGDRVRLQPKARADVIDIALKGRTARIESVEQDVENRVHLAVVLEEDPGKDLGLLRQPGHRFFYGPDEVEPLREPPA